jgi:hypothetical protein
MYRTEREWFRLLVEFARLFNRGAKHAFNAVVMNRPGGALVMKRFLTAVGFVLFLVAGQASANIIFTFSGVTFDDGGTLTGTFTTNDALTSLVDFDITTSTNGSFGFHYTPGTADPSSTSLPSILVFDSLPSMENILQITFNGGLTATGAPILIGQFDSFEQTDFGDLHRQITAGSVTVNTVPEPSTIALLGIGVLGIGVGTYIRRRRKD